MAKTTTIRGWTLRDDGENRVTLTTGDRPPLIIDHEPGMSRDVLIEYATTRVLEAELRDAGMTVDTTTGAITNRDDLPAALLRDYERHVAVSRANQAQRENLRRIADEFGEGGE